MTNLLNKSNLLFSWLRSTEPRLVQVRNRGAWKQVEIFEEWALADQVPQIAENLPTRPARCRDAQRLAGQCVHFRIGMLPAIQERRLVESADPPLYVTQFQPQR